MMFLYTTPARLQVNDSNATCKKTGPGTSTCKCMEGFTGDGKDCDEIDACADPEACSADALCEKTGPGTSNCSCNDGYLGDGEICENEFLGIMKQTSIY